jgi:signal transduction histidine kinase
MQQHRIPHSYNRTARRDLLIIVFVALVCFALAKWVNAFEVIYAETRIYEEWDFDFDELVVVAGLLSVAFAVFAYRRWQELAREIQERMLIQQELQLAYAQLQNSIAQRQALEERRWAEEQASVRREAELTATLAERARIARELHDTLAQGLVGVTFQLEGTTTLIESDSAMARTQLDLALSMVRNSLEEVRRAIWDMRPQSTEQGGMTNALSELVDQLPTDVHVQVRVVGAPKALPTLIEHHLLRIAQEALNNAAHHAQANHIDVELRFNAQDVRLYVRDDGCGFDISNVPAARNGHFGLVGMRERVREIAGRLRIQSALGEGTCIEVSAPFN